MRDNMIHIAYGLNDNFAELTCTSMASVLTNTKADCHFYLFEYRLSDEAKNKIILLEGLFRNCKISFIHMEPDEDDKYIVFETARLTKEAYIRCMLPDMLPRLEKVLWMDGDTVAEGDIRDIWQIPFEGSYVCMVPDYSFTDKRIRRLALDMEGLYFNTGIILMDLTALRRMAFSKLIQDNIQKYYGKIKNNQLEWYADQDVINPVLEGYVKAIAFKYNSYAWDAAVMDIPQEEIVEAILNPFIIHFIGSRKPGHITTEMFLNPLWHRYFHYKKLTPYADMEDAVRMERYNMREKHLLDSLLLPWEESASHRIFVLRHRLFEITMRKLSQLKGRQVMIWGFNETVPMLVAYLIAQGIEVGGIVDGIERNQEYKVFHHQVQPADIIFNMQEKPFILLTMRSMNPMMKCVDILSRNGFRKEDYYSVYEQITVL